MVGDLFTARLLVSISLAVTVFVAFWAIHFLLAYQKERQAQVDRASEIGRDQEGLQTPRGGFLLRLAERYDRSEGAKPIQEKLWRANIKMKASDFQAIRFFIGFAVAYILILFVDAGLVVGLGAAIVTAVFLPRLFLYLRRNSYLKVFNEQLVEITALMASSLRAGLSIPQAIDNVARKILPPAKPEFERVSRELKLGISFERTMQDMLQRVPSEDLKIMVTVILIQRQVGGNLVRALSELSITMGERLRIANDIQTMTSEARYSVNIIILLPVMILILLRTTMPGLIDAIFTDPIGWVVLALFVAVQTIAYVIIRGIADIKV